MFGSGAETEADSSVLVSLLSEVVACNGVTEASRSLDFFLKSFILKKLFPPVCLDSI